MPRKKLMTVAAVILFTALWTGEKAVWGQAVAAPTARPKLIVMLVIDQFRFDYLERFRPQFAAGGFNLLLQGADFIDCRYDYATTATCPGHATLFTGGYANMHGMIGNDWFDAARGRKVYCVEDPEATLVGSKPGPGFSPRNLIGSTIGDELRIATNFGSRVIAISLKDRASVVPGGHTANAAYWYDAQSGRFVTSSYYMKSLPEWVERFNASTPAKHYCGKAWQALPETPDAGGRVLKQFRPEAGEACPDGKFIGWLNNTPYMNEIELKFAAAAVQSEQLGRGPAPDLLAVSLSVNDYIGHSFGPYSDEVADTTLRTDRYLAGFFKDLDQTVGLDNVWITLSADHGVAPNPKFIKEHRLGSGHAEPAKLEKAVEQALSGAFGQDQWVQDLSEFYISLNPFALKNHKVDRAQAETVAARAASEVPGVRAAFTRTQLLTGNLPVSPLARKAANSFYAERSGDVFLILDPYAVLVEGEIGTTHGTPWNYDAQVPLIFWGAAFKPGVYVAPSQPIDLVPTLAAALHLTQPSGAEGRPLREALR